MSDLFVETGMWRETQRSVKTTIRLAKQRRHQV